MTPDIWLALTGVFISIALITGISTSRVLALRAPERRRLREMVFQHALGVGARERKGQYGHCELQHTATPQG